MACGCSEEGLADRDYDRKMDISPERRFEGADFDKFMSRILVEEKRPTPKVTVLNDSPQRQLAARYQERPMGRTRMGGKQS